MFAKLESKRPHNSRIFVLFTGSLALLGAAAAPAAQIDCNWLGGIGTWSTPSQWSCGVVPNNGANTYNVFVDRGAAASSVVSMNLTVRIDNLTVDAGETVEIVNGNQLFMMAGASGGMVSNAGTIRLNSTGGNTYFQPANGVVTLSGGGVLELSNQTTNWIYQSNGGSLINMNHTIRGSGNLGWSGAPTTILNQGTVIANGSAPLICDPGSAVFTNTGMMQAESGGVLQLQGSGGFSNAGGTIEALNGSTVNLAGTQIRGGTLRTSGTGVIQSISTSSLDGTVNAVTNAGRLVIPSSRVLLANGTINNTGTIRLDSTGADTYFRPTNGVLTLTGGGVVELSNQTTNWIYQSNGGSLINMNHTIRGSGNLGWSGAPTTILNQGTVIANGSAPLICDPGSAVFTNTGMMQAESGGVLQLQGSGGFSNAGGTIEALNGSTVNLAGTQIRGGTLRTSGTGVIQSISTSSLDGTVNAVTNAGRLVIPPSRFLLANGTINNTGTIRLDSTGADTYFQPTNGVLTLTGGGVVELSDQPRNWIYQSGGGSLVNLNNTIRGAGNIGWNGAQTTITNHGDILADAPAPLIFAGFPFDNRGVVAVTGAGGAQLQSGSFENHGVVRINVGRELRSNPALTQPDDGIIAIQASGITAGLAGRVTVLNTFALNGTLRLEAVGGYMPMMSDRIPVATATTYSGSFDQIEAPGLSGTLRADFYVNGTTGIVVIVRPGDANCDGLVNFDDINAFVTSLTGEAAYQAAFPGCEYYNNDANLDGGVNFDDIGAFVCCLVSGSCDSCD